MDKAEKRQKRLKLLYEMQTPGWEDDPEKVKKIQKIYKEEFPYDEIDHNVYTLTVLENGNTYHGATVKELRDNSPYSLNRINNAIHNNGGIDDEFEVIKKERKESEVAIKKDMYCKYCGEHKSSTDFMKFQNGNYRKMCKKCFNLSRVEKAKEINNKNKKHKDIEKFAKKNDVVVIDKNTFKDEFINAVNVKNNKELIKFIKNNKAEELKQAVVYELDKNYEDSYQCYINCAYYEKILEIVEGVK